MFLKLLHRSSRRRLCRTFSTTLASSPDFSVSHLVAKRERIIHSRNFSLCLARCLSFSDRKKGPLYVERNLSAPFSTKENDGDAYSPCHDVIQSISLPQGPEPEGGKEHFLKAEAIGDSFPKTEGKRETCLRLEGGERESFSKSEGEEELLSCLEADDDTSLMSNIEGDNEETDITNSDPDEEDKDEKEDEEGDGVDMTNVSEDLKEMLQEGYVIESIEDDGFASEGVAELLTIEEIKQVLEEVRARYVQVFPVSDRCEWTDTMIVATGISDRHVRGIADALVFKIKKKGQVEPPLYPTIEGQVGGKWLVVDCGNIIIHILDEESREYYKLEDMWTGSVRASTADEDLQTMLKKAGFKDPNY